MEATTYQIIKDFGFPVFCTFVLGIVVWKLYIRMDTKIDALHTYIRENLQETTSNYKSDNKVLVEIIRELHPHLTKSEKPNMFDRVNPHDETAKIMAAIKS